MDRVNANRRPKVLIAGAGIGGLVAGLALLQRGIEVEIFEQASELRELGAGVQLSANGTSVLIALGLEPHMQAIACEPSGKEIRLFSTGRDLEAVRPRRLLTGDLWRAVLDGASWRLSPRAGRRIQCTGTRTSASQQPLRRI